MPATTGGFTLIELLVVMVVIALLLTIAAPRYFHSVNKSREAVLRQDLAVMREAIDQHYADTGRYPQSLEQLVQARYLRRIPLDPMTESEATWQIVPPADAAQAGIYDIRSGAEGVGLDGTAYHDW